MLTIPTKSPVERACDEFPVVGVGTDRWNASRHQNGVVAYATNLVEGLKQLGAKVCVIANHVEPGNNETAVQAVPSWPEVRRGIADRVLAGLGRRIAPQYTDGRLLAERLLHALREARRLHGIEIFETEESCGVARLVIPRSPVPIIVRLHGPWFLVGPASGVRQDGVFRRRVARERTAIESAAAVSAPSLHVIKQTRDFYNIELPRARVIPNPIKSVPDSQRWDFNRCDPNRFLFVGRFDKGKGADILLDAFRQLLQQNPAARLTLVGLDHGITDDRGNLIRAEQYLDRLFPEPSHRAHVEWLGLQSPDELQALRRQSFACVLASRYESFSMVTLEAMACGCPIIAPNVGGIPELIRHEHNGILFQPGNAVELAQAMLSLMHRPAVAQALAAQANLDSLTRHDPAHVARQTVEFYRDVLADFPRHQPH